MRDVVEIGLGKSAVRGYHFADVSLVPSRRTRGTRDISIAWQIDAHQFDLPLMTAPSDAIVSPASAKLIDQLGGLAVINGEGLWAKYEDPRPVFERIVAEAAVNDDLMRELYSEPVKPELLGPYIGELNRGGARVAVRLSPQNTLSLADSVLDAGIDILVIHGTVVSAEHVAVGRQALNLKTFIADLDIPVIVGGCTNYQTALHLMRTGAAGVIVGVGSHIASTTASVLGIEVPMATAVADAAAARRDYLDETGGRYVHIIAYGDLETGADIAKAIACGADAVMLGDALMLAAEAPAGGMYWDTTVSHPNLPRSGVAQIAQTEQCVPLAELLVGPTTYAGGEHNLFGALRRAMAKCGYSNLKEFQKVDLVLSHGTLA